MIINHRNMDEVNSKIYVHDQILDSISFEREAKKLTLYVKTFELKPKKHKIVFNSVALFSMTACDFWGENECILDMECLTECGLLMPKLKEKWKSDPFNSFNRSRWDCLFETRITFKSGDELTVVAEAIEFEQLELCLPNW